MKKSAFIFLFILICFSCNDPSDKDEDVCTESFGQVLLNIQYDDGTPVGIDHYKTMWGDREVTPLYTPDEYLAARKNGEYAILNDSCRKDLEGLIEKVTVTGFIGERVVFKEDYTVGADKCHVFCYDTEPLVITVRRWDDSDVVCTDILKNIFVKVRYEDGSPVMLDSYRVMWGDRNITPADDFDDEYFQLNRKHGSYAIVNDRMVNELAGSAEKVTVTGFIREKEVFEEDYLVGADKCHITYIGTKPLLITLKK